MISPFCSSSFFLVRCYVEANLLGCLVSVYGDEVVCGKTNFSALVAT